MGKREVICMEPNQIDNVDVLYWRLTATPYYQSINAVSGGLRLMPYGNGFPEPFTPLVYNAAASVYQFVEPMIPSISFLICCGCSISRAPIIFTCRFSPLRARMQRSLHCILLHLSLAKSISLALIAKISLAEIAAL